MKFKQPFGATDENASYTNGNEETGEKGSYVDALAIEAPQREIVHTIEESGQTPEEGNNTQLSQAIRILSEGKAKSVIHCQSLYQELHEFENGVVYVEDEKIIAWVDVAAALTLSFNLDHITKLGEEIIVTFELYLNMPTTYGITWPAGIDWGKDEEAPDLSEDGLYLLTFRYLKKIKKWQGCLQKTFS